MTKTHPALAKMLERYELHSTQSSFDALREILQEMVLLGLYEGGFFKHAVFYGGTALRILHGLPRFSEDLDFSLLDVDKKFDLCIYEDSIVQTLKSFGFEVSIEIKIKNHKSAIASAFVKGNTIEHLININTAKSMTDTIHKNKVVKIKLEVDTKPPSDFESEHLLRLTPRPFSLHVMVLPSLYAGKMHALLCRSWSSRPKGRDWYDLIWYVSQDVVLDIKHLQARLNQSCKWLKEHDIKVTEELDEKELKLLLQKRVKSLDITKAKNDLRPFINDISELNLWSEAFFMQIVEKIKIS
jgi:predicted nucleotidyltransferase component of viral defense system